MKSLWFTQNDHESCVYHVYVVNEILISCKYIAKTKWSIFAILIKDGHRERTKSSEMEALEIKQGSKCSDFFAIDFYG